MGAGMRTIMVAWIGICVVAGCGDDPVGPGGGQEPLDQRVEDLQELRRWVGVEGSFSSSARTEARARIEEILAQGPADDLARFYVEVASVVGLADNGHSNLSRAPLAAWGFLPIRLFWFADGPRVVRAGPTAGDLLGARIDSIEGLTPSELVERFDPYHGGTDGHYRHYYGTRHLISPAFLHAAGMTADPDEVRLWVTRPDGGGSEEVALAAVSDGPSATVPWRLLIPSGLGGEAGWTALTPDSTPLHLRDHVTPFRYAYLSDLDASYIQPRGNSDQGGMSIQSFAAETRARIEADAPRAIILDNRANPGGNLTLTAAFARDLPGMVPADGTVYVLTSNATFSAGIYTSFYPKAADPGKTVIVGEHVGDRIRFWAESTGPWRLPHSGFTIGRSTGLHDLSRSCTASDCWAVQSSAQALDLTIETLEPDVAIGLTFADHRAGIDPLMTWMRGELGGG